MGVKSNRTGIGSRVLVTAKTVSYTHLDVYKRQVPILDGGPKDEQHRFADSKVSGLCMYFRVDCGLSLIHI